MGDADPFDLPGGPRGALCVHGFTGTPFEVRPLAEALHRRGLTVSAPRLPGHGTSPADLDRTTWLDWARAVDRALDGLLARCERVAIAGMSLGGALALHTARHRPDDVAAVAALAAPVWLPRAARLALRALALPPLARRVRALPKRGGSDVRDPAMRARNPSYPVIPVRALGELDRFVQVVRRELPFVRAPTLVVHSRRDHTVPPACADEIERAIGARVVRRRTLCDSFHVITIDVERDLVADEVGRFFDTHLSDTHWGGAA